MNIRTSQALLIASLALNVGCGDDETVAPRGAAGSAGSAGTGGSAGVDGGGGPGPLFGDRVPVSETLPIAGVKAPVDIVRDKYGMVHIYARSVEDVMFAQGYMMAVDRHGQLDLLRRVAAGRMAERFGAFSPDQIDEDITMRTIGLQRTADEIYQNMPAGSLPKRAVDAFAKGITAWITNLKAGKAQLNAEFAGFNEDAFTPWKPEESIAMGRVQSWNLSYDADSDISLTERWNQALATFTAQATDPDLAKRAGYMKDVMRFDPVDPTTPIQGYPNGTAAYTPDRKGTRLARNGARATLASARAFMESIERVKRRFGYDEYSGSNNWAVDAAHSEGGGAMLASDPHLSLVSPMIFWPCHLVVDNPDQPSENIEVAGIAFAGIPGVILGATRHVAWGATTTGYDVTDVYEETISSDGQGVVFKGATVPFEKINQKLSVSGVEQSWDILVVPHHGPIVPTIVEHKVVPPAPGSKALSVRWTGHQPSTEVESIFKLVQAKNVDEARTALDTFGVGGQNWMLADSDGNIAWTSHVLLPYRDPRALTFDATNYSGVHPLLVLNGTSGEHEWTGKYLESQYVPQDKNPARGFIATANADNLGVTLDNNPTNDKLPDGTPFYIGGDFDPGWRIGQIYGRLRSATANGGKLSLDELSSIQADVRYRLAERTLAPMITALEHAQAEAQTPNSFPEVRPVVSDSRFTAANFADVIATLKKWSNELGYEAASGMNPDDNTPATDPAEVDASKATAIFSAWVVRAMAFALEDEARLLGGRQNVGGGFTIKGFVRILTHTPQTELLTFDATTGESALWDDVSTKGVTERRDAVLGLALLAAIDDLNKLLGADRTGWRWGKLHTLRFDPLVPTLWDGFANPPLMGDSVFPNGFPRHGGQDAVDASNFAIMRGKTQDLDFSYGGGPVQRFVAEMKSTGPVFRNALPGGAIANTKSKHFKDDAELWRRNQTHPVPFAIDDVVAAWQQGDEHIRLNPASP